MVLYGIIEGYNPQADYQDFERQQAIEIEQELQETAFIDLEELEE